MYFAMIMWKDREVGPVTPENGDGAKLWATRQEAEKAIKEMPLSKSKEIRIFDLDNCE
jgi:hypothetical protein